jgi:hypothetical protein
VVIVSFLMLWNYYYMYIGSIYIVLLKLAILSYFLSLLFALFWVVFLSCYYFETKKNFKAIFYSIFLGTGKRRRAIYVISVCHGDRFIWILHKKVLTQMWSHGVLRQYSKFLNSKTLPVSWSSKINFYVIKN